MKLWFPLFFVLYELCGYLSNDMYLPAMLAMSTDFSASIDLVQFSIGSWLIGNGLAQILLGPLSDRYGRRLVLLGGGLVFLLTLWGCGVSATMTEFLIWRFVQGMGVASIMIAGYATIHENFNDQQATRILAITGSVSVLAPMLGPLFGALILESYSWRVIFYSLIIPTILALLCLALISPRSKKSDAKSLTLGQSFLGYKKVFLNKVFVGKTSAYSLHYGAVILWITSSPYILIGQGGMSERLYSLWQIPIFVAVVAGANSIRLLELKFNYSSIIKIGQVISLFGGALFLATAYLATSSEALVLAFLPISFGLGILSSPLARQAMTSPTGEQGTITGAFFLIMSLIGGIASMFMSYVSDTPVKLAACTLFLTGLGFILVKDHQVKKFDEEI